MKKSSPVVPSSIMSAAVSLLKPFYPSLDENALTDFLNKEGAPAADAIGDLGERPVTRKQAAAWLSIGVRSVDYLISKGRLEAVKVGPRCIRIKPASVRALLVNMPQKGANA